MAKKKNNIDLYIFLTNFCDFLFQSLAASFSPNFAPIKAKMKAIPPPIKILVKEKPKKRNGVKKPYRKVNATARKAPMAGSRTRMDGETKPIINPPTK